MGRPRARPAYRDVADFQTGAAPGSYFDDTPVIHHGNPIGDIFDDRKIVGYEQQGEFDFSRRSLSRFRICACTETSSADTRLVADDQTWLQHEGTRNADALQLSAGEFVRITEAMLSAARPTCLAKIAATASSRSGRLQASLECRAPCARRNQRFAVDRNRPWDPGIPAAQTGAAA